VRCNFLLDITTIQFCYIPVFFYINRLTQKTNEITRMCQCVFNKYRFERPQWGSETTGCFHAADVIEFHKSLPGYSPTPLVAVPALAESLGVGEIYIKDESHRFGLNAFKVLGASYAIYRFLKWQWGGSRGKPFDINDLRNDRPYRRLAGAFTFCTATDGNHGRAVAWTARRMSQPAVIFVPRGTAKARIENIESEEAEVVVVDGTYDDAVRRAADGAENNGWQIISDTAYDGYMEIPGYVMAGYTTMFAEMEDILHQELDPGVDIVFLQCGVGSFAAAATWYYISKYGVNRPRLVSVEPTEAACLYESIRSKGGNVARAGGSLETVMAGLNCGTPSLRAWPILRDGLDIFMTISDDYAVDAVRRLYYPKGDDPQIISGESGAAGLGGLLALLRNDRLAGARDRIRIDSRTRILIINTEGATDPVSFEKIISE
jgi:diaminopropionate ammonia-lyase